MLDVPIWVATDQQKCYPFLALKIRFMEAVPLEVLSIALKNFLKNDTWKI